MFDKLSVLILYEKCLEARKARVTDVHKNKRVRGRPNPLNTIEAQKLISKKLKISSANAMEIMERLY